MRRQPASLQNTLPSGGRIRDGEQVRDEGGDLGRKAIGADMHGMDLGLVAVGPGRKSGQQRRQAAGGDTEFASMRAAFAALAPDEQRALRGRVAIHDFGWSRSRVDAALVTEAERSQHPPVRQALVLEENPYGPALYLGAHARSIEGMGDSESRVLIDRLMALATQPDFTYAHKWRPHDLVMWDNRAVLHRATPFATTTERRTMVRTCVAGTAPTLAAAA